MQQKCIRILNRNVFNAVERLERWAKVSLFEEIKKMRESGSISGIRAGLDEYAGVEVFIEEDSVGFYSTKIFTITAFFIYSK